MILLFRSILLVLFLPNSTTKDEEVLDVSHSSNLTEHVDYLTSSLRMGKELLSDTLDAKIEKVEGEDVFMACADTERSVGPIRMVWKKEDEEDWILGTLYGYGANSYDPRIELIHNDGGKISGLFISNLTMSDSGLYSCQQFNPRIKSFKMLSVVKNTELKKMQNMDDITSCCIHNHVSSSCLEYCNPTVVLSKRVKTIPDMCLSQLPWMVRCMVGGRDHAPCCIKADIPPMCTDLCRGEFEYNLETADQLRRQFDCSSYLAAILHCIELGLGLLPRQPQGFTVEAINDTAIKVNWDHRFTQEHSVYKVNVTLVEDLHPLYGVSVVTSVARRFYNNTRTIVITNTNTSHVISGLSELAIYEVTLWAENDHGSSLPTYSVQVVTHTRDQKTLSSKESAPVLPDIRSCCISSNVTHAPCLDKFCEPYSVARVAQDDLVICAPWALQMFSCLVDGKDHTPCCAERRIPPTCHDMCSGKAVNISVSHFLCVEYMSELSSCMLKGYGVIPSSPNNFRFSNLHSDWAILHWDPPSFLPETVTGYVVAWKKLNGSLQFKKQVSSPYILEDLDPDSTYQVFVQPLNDHGLGDSSTRITFHSPARVTNSSHHTRLPYNQSLCCESAGVSSQCLPICDYNLTQSTLSKLEVACNTELGRMVRCATGGRNHENCCQRRGVPEICLGMCRGHHSYSESEPDFILCQLYIGAVIQCWEEGTTFLPPPVNNLKVISVGDNLVFLAWEDASFTHQQGAEAEYYEVRYRQISDTELHQNTFVSTVPFAKIVGLKKDEVYQFAVIAINSRGSSLPTSVVTVRVSTDSWEGSPVHGSPSPPHKLRVTNVTVVSFRVSWDPPKVAAFQYPLTYILYYGVSNGSQVSNLTSEMTTMIVNGLSSATLYKVYATAISHEPQGNLESAKSEEVSLWTVSVIPPRVAVGISYEKDGRWQTITDFSYERLGAGVPVVKEGDSITVICKAQGSPTPTVSMFVGGVEVKTDARNYMSGVVPNVTRTMSKLTCTADNGYGTDLSTETILIQTAPELVAPINSTVLEGDDVTVRCVATAGPATILYISRSPHLENNTSTSLSRSSTDTVSLTISNATTNDGGAYYCHASNTLGQATSPMNVIVTNVPAPVLNVSSCCKKRNVTPNCLQICDFGIDFDWNSSDGLQCTTEFYKVVACAADGLDHRQCCYQRGVSSDVVDWCRGVTNKTQDLVALTFSQDMMWCFHQGKGDLPGPPRDVRMRPLNTFSAVVFWDLPVKNPDRIETYRVFSRVVGERKLTKTDVKQRSCILHFLKPGEQYEVFVKAGNTNGTSPLSEPLRFVFHGTSNITDSVIITSTISPSIPTTEELTTSLPHTSTNITLPSTNISSNTSSTSLSKSSSHSRTTWIFAVLGIILVIAVLFLIVHNINRRRSRQNAANFLDTTSDSAAAFENPLYIMQSSSNVEPSVEIRTQSHSQPQSDSSVPPASSPPILEANAEDASNSPNPGLIQRLTDNARTGVRGFSRF